jgi:hypothetical protein
MADLNADYELLREMSLSREGTKRSLTTLRNFAGLHRIGAPKAG